MISHRITSVMDADVIYVLEDGVITDYGTHNDLKIKKMIFIGKFVMSRRQIIGRRVMFKEHKELIMYLFKPFKSQFLILTLLLVLIALLDAAIPYATKKMAIDNFITPMTTEGLYPFAVMYGSAIIVFGALIVVFIIVAGKLESGIAIDSEKKLLTVCRIIILLTSMKKVLARFFLK